MIRHTVVFKLKYNIGSTEEQEFLAAAQKLAVLAGVQKFECLRQIGKKNKFDFGLSMEFENMEAYEGYNNHPMHISFVQTYWLRDVAEFLEIDYEPYV